MTSPNPGYLVAATSVPWLLADLEAALEKRTGLALCDAAFVLGVSGSRVPTRDEVTVALNGLVDIGILQEATGGHFLNAERLASTREYRRGVKEGLAVGRVSVDEPVTLCVSVPPEAPSDFKERIASSAADLRSGIVSVLGAATDRLVLASPFWDVATAFEVGELARRRAAAGVRIDILGRFGPSDGALSALRHLFLGVPGIRMFRWYRAEPSGDSITTFHFKAVVADDGARAYVGTANLTWASLRSTMELGFIVGSRQGRCVAQILESVIGLSERLDGP
jgi:hypothetical protein